MVVVVAAAVCRRTEGEGCAGLESLDVTGRDIMSSIFLWVYDEGTSCCCDVVSNCEGCSQRRDEDILVPRNQPHYGMDDRSRRGSRF